MLEVTSQALNSVDGKQRSGWVNPQLPVTAASSLEVVHDGHGVTQVHPDGVGVAPVRVQGDGADAFQPALLTA